MSWTNGNGHDRVILREATDSQLEDEFALRGMDFMNVEKFIEIGKAVEMHRTGKQGSSEALVKLCYDMVGKIV